MLHDTFLKINKDLRPASWLGLHTRFLPFSDVNHVATSGIIKNRRSISDTTQHHHDSNSLRSQVGNPLPSNQPNRKWWSWGICILCHSLSFCPSTLSSAFRQKQVLWVLSPAARWGSLDFMSTSTSCSSFVSSSSPSSFSLSPSCQDHSQRDRQLPRQHIIACFIASSLASLFYAATVGPAKTEHYARLNATYEVRTSQIEGQMNWNRMSVSGDHPKKVIRGRLLLDFDLRLWHLRTKDLMGALCLCNDRLRSFQLSRTPKIKIS